MSGPFFSGYDAWKTREPDHDEGPVCEHCGEPLQLERSTYVYWVCERCDVPEADEPDYDAWAADEFVAEYHR